MPVFVIALFALVVFGVIAILLLTSVLFEALSGQALAKSPKLRETAASSGRKRLV